MSSLLHQLLFDVQQRCRYLAGELARLATSVPPQVENYRAGMEHRMQRVLGQIDQMLHDPGLQHPQLAPNYYVDYKRLTELVQMVEEGPALVLGRLTADDLFLTQLMAKLCREINYPHNPPICSALSTQYYWAVVQMDLVFVPATEPHHLLALADMYHELAHFVLVRLRNDFVTPALTLIKRHFDRMIREGKQKNFAADTLAFLKEQREQWLTAWYREFACDMIATYWSGPAFGWCNVRLCANLSADLFQGVDTHPADDARSTAIQEMLEKMGQTQAAANLQQRWEELVTLSSGQKPSKYDLSYPRELLRDLAGLLFNACGTAAFVGWQAPQQLQPVHVTSVLNEAWSSFLADPMNYADAERGLLARLRNDLGS
jgi:hypothetical protein